MNVRIKLLIALVFVMLGLLYSIGFMVLFNNSDYYFGMTLISISRFTPDMIIIILGGLLLGSVWGASVGALIVLGGFIFAGFGLFSPIAIWHFPISIFSQYLVSAICVGLIAKKASSYIMIVLSVFCSLLLGHFAGLIVSFFTHRDLLTFSILLRAWVNTNGVGVFLLALLIPIVYLALKQFLPSDNPTI